MAYTTIDKPTDYFNTVTYTGTAGGQTITGVGHQPDFIWVKQRGDAGYDHSLHNSVSGLLKQLISNSTAAEITNTDTVTSNNADGFVLGADTAGPNANSNNQDGKTYVAWNWKAGTSFTNDASATGIGSFDSSGSVNTDAGFSIISYTGNGVAGATVAHGLGAAPKVVFGKARNSGGEDWFFGHSSIGFNKYLKLDTTDAANTTSIVFNDTAPSSSVVTLGSNGIVNSGSYNHIMYCFAEKQGYSKFGSYTGNGNADGPFVYTGFKPAFVMMKNTSNATSSDWLILDNKRDPYNVANTHLDANNSDAESSASWVNTDLLSNGFKLRTTDETINESGNTFIYMAFAENPFVTSTAIPACAR